MTYIDVNRTTHTNLDVLQESRIDDHWNVDVDRNVRFMERSYEVHILEGKTSQKIYVAWMAAYTNSGNCSERCSGNGRSKKPKLDNARHLRGIRYIDPEDGKYKETNQKRKEEVEIPVK